MPEGLELLFCCPHPIRSLTTPSPQHGPGLPAQEDLLPGFLSVCGGQAREPGGLPLVGSEMPVFICSDKGQGLRVLSSLGWVTWRGGFSFFIPYFPILEIQKTSTQTGLVHSEMATRRQADRVLPWIDCETVCQVLWIVHCACAIY